MEESGKSIREPNPTLQPALPDSWLCSEDDVPQMRFVHDGAGRQYRLKIGAVWYEHFGENTEGEWLYRRMR